MIIGKGKIGYDRESQKWIGSDGSRSVNNSSTAIFGIWKFDKEKKCYYIHTDGGQKIYLTVEEDNNDHIMNDDCKDEILYELQERVKELTALHQTATIIQDNSKSKAEVIKDIVSILPPAWQYPHITGARITFGEMEVKTPNFITTQWVQSTSFCTGDGSSGTIDICYLKETPPAFEGPFLKEERELINSLGKILASYFERSRTEEALRKSYDEMEEKVKTRTLELSKLNKVLEEEIAERKKVDEKIKKYQEELRELALELSLAEEKERREIASNLHDHIGQALAIIKLRLQELQGNAIFCGFEQYITQIRKLLDQTIHYTRNLTFELSPPVLYELGILSAIEWLAEEAPKKYGFTVDVKSDGQAMELSKEAEIILFQAVRELIVNVAKHAGATVVNIIIEKRENSVSVKVEDNGSGFDTVNQESESIKNCGFGLFSIRERIRHLGGSCNINSIQGKGTGVIILLPTQIL